MDQLNQRFKIAERAIKGPCIFCLKSNVKFSKEHLPPETLVGKDALILVDWVCSSCNGKFKKEDEYFSKHYHGSVFRALQTIIGKKGRGAEVKRKDVEIKWRPETKTVYIRLKRKPRTGEIAAANPNSSYDKIGHIVIEESRAVNPRRLGNSLAKMALETVAYLNPAGIQQPALEPIRQYAQRRRNQIPFLPYAYGASEGKLGVELTGVKFEDELSEVMVALLFVPGVVYAVQLSDHSNLAPLAVVAQVFQPPLFIDQDGSRTSKSYVNLDLHIAENDHLADAGAQ